MQTQMPRIFALQPTWVMNFVGGVGGACSPALGDNTAPSGHCFNSFVHLVLASGSLCSLGTLEAVLLLGQIERGAPGQKDALSNCGSLPSQGYLWPFPFLPGPFVFCLLSSSILGQVTRTSKLAVFAPLISQMPWKVFHRHNCTLSLFFLLICFIQTSSLLPLGKLCNHRKFVYGKIKISTEAKV